MTEYPYIKRLLAERLKKHFQHFSVVVVTGARQVGKSTLFDHLFDPALPRVVFDPVVDVENARSDPDLFLENRRPPLVLDEIQYVPELVSAIKRRLERNKAPGQYCITGSQQWGVMRTLSESLAGRAVFLELSGFCLPELSSPLTGGGWIKNWIEKQKLPETTSRLNLPFTTWEQIWRGFLPETRFLPRELIPSFHASYHSTYVERDIRLLAEVSDIHLFGRFFKLCSALSAQEINFSQLGREIGITPQTAGRWLDMLQATFQWTKISAYTRNSVKKISGKPKGYISDTGMACWAQALSTPESFGGHPLWGAFFETAVVNDIRKRCLAMDFPPHFYHWRAHSGAEVDLILERDGILFPLEIKGASRVDKNDARGSLAFREHYSNLRIAPGLVITAGNECGKIAENVFMIPWDTE